MDGHVNLGEALVAALASSSAQVSDAAGSVLTAEELASDSARLACELGERGLGQNEPVVLFVDNSPRDLIGFLGLWLAGGVAVPVHAATPQAPAEALTARVGNRFVVRSAQLQQVTSTMPRPRQLLNGAALIVFTSGSTGQPKGVVIGHKGLLLKLEILSRLLTVASADVVAVPLRLTFIFGMWVSLLSLLAGARLILVPKFSSMVLRTHLEDMTVLAAVPTILRDLCADPSIAAPRLRRILTGGEPFSPALAESLALAFPDAKPFDLFGLTETGSCDFCLCPKDQPAGWGTIGRPTEGVAFRIMPLPELGLPSDTGELQIRTPSRMLGYLDDPALTDKAFQDGYFKTGDLATVRPDGFVRLVGRSKDIISRGGNKIAPLEIETAFARHQGIRAAMAVGVPDNRLGESLHLLVVRRNPDLSESNLRDWAKARVEKFKTPDAFHFVDALPTGQTGKVDRIAARRLLEEIRQIK